MLGLGLMSLDNKLKTIAIALFDKDRLTMVKLYLNGIRPSDIAGFLAYDRITVRSKIQRGLNQVDVNMIKDDNIFKKLMGLKEVYDFRCNICLLCSRKVSYADMLKHLLAYHKDYLIKVLNEVLGK
jgi:hypothetical protein